LSGKDFIEVLFKADVWYNFQKKFRIISEYFNSEEAVANKMLDQQFMKYDFFTTFTTFTIFTTFYDFIWIKVHNY